MKELDWGRLDSIVTGREGLRKIGIGIDKDGDGEGEPWLAQELKEILDARLGARVRELVHYT